ncbi:hypothetical protein BDR06DRAFT_951884 [Suillus hirtellus]|nr:hypothetical protein BDR06DRAFT_951884 [Suillus hirtellus]
MSYQVLVVLDPQFSHSLAQDSYRCIDWVTYDYPAPLAADLLDSPTLRGFVPVRLYEKFEKFQDILISSKPNFRHTFQQYHSICGGLDLMVDPSKQAGGLDSPTRLQKYLSRLQILELIVLVWPSSKEILHASNKFNVIVDLNQIASRMVNFPRPLTTCLSRINLSQSFEGCILKHEGSDCNHHIFLPGQVDLLNLLPDHEWWIILVDCQPLWVVHMAPGNGEGEWVFLHQDADLSLAEMSLHIRKPYVFDDIMDPVGGTLSEQRQANQELESFVTTALNQLIGVEEESLGAPSSLRLIVQLDLGVMHGPDGQLGYFVNEVEQGTGIGLFSMGHPRWTLWLADEFGCMFSMT